MRLEDPDRVHLNYHGLDPRVTQRVSQNQRAVHHSDNPVTRLISIGRLVPTKGHDVVIRACAKLVRSGKAIHLSIVGSGPLEQELNELIEIEGLSDQVELLGALAFEDVLNTLEDSRVFCLAPRMIAGQPPDGIPNVIAEAMALHVPVVTTRVSAIPELIEHNVTGKLVTVDDVDAFADELDHLISQPEVLEKIRTAAAKKVSHLFNQEKNIDELLALFAQHIPGGVPRLEHH